MNLNISRTDIENVCGRILPPPKNVSDVKTIYCDAGRHADAKSVSYVARVVLAAALLVAAAMSMSAQRRDCVGCGRDTVGSETAAYDPEWLAKYYGFNWSSRHASGAAPGNTPAEESALPTASPQKAAASSPEKEYTLSLRANLLRWATLTPDLGIEWRIIPSFGILVNGSWTSWSWNDAGRRYALWEVAPEVRWYLGERKVWYVGAMFKAGQFNYKFSGTGKQGDLIGGGITGGYQLKLTEALSMDFTLGLGYLNADTERYDVIDGVRVRSGNETKHWIGPVNAGVTLVWKLF